MYSWKKRLLRLALNVGTLAVSLVIAGLAVELLIRLFLPQPVGALTPGLLVPDPPRRYRLGPNHQGTISNIAEFTHSVSINSLGLRGAEISDKTSDTFRILILGDSFAFGWGVEYDQTFGARLERELNSETRKVQVLNGAVPGYSLLDEQDWLERYGLQLQPDLVLIAVFLGNDILEATAGYRQRELSHSVPEAGTARGLRLWIYTNSHFVRLVARANIPSLFGFSDPWPVVYLRGLLTVHTDDPSVVEAQEGRRVSRAALTRLIELAALHRFRLAAVVIPANFNISTERWQRMLALAGVEPTGLDPQVSRRFFNSLLDEYNIPTCDLWTLFSTALEHGQHVYYEQDLHWTDLGHSLATDAVRDFLLEEDLVQIPLPLLPEKQKLPHHQDANDSP